MRDIETERSFSFARGCIIAISVRRSCHARIEDVSGLVRSDAPAVLYLLRHLRAQKKQQSIAPSRTRIESVPEMSFRWKYTSIRSYLEGL